MKRIISATLAVILALSVFSSCGRYVGSNDDEDVESGTTQENPNESDNEEDAQPGAMKARQPESEPADMEDVDALYEFVGQDYPEMSKSSFEYCYGYSMYRLDVTGDGTDELLFDTPEMEDMLIISGDNGEYQRIRSNITIYKYGTVPSLRDGFLIVNGTTGGTGEQFTDMSLYVFKDGELHPVLEGVPMHHSVSHEGLTVEETGSIEGDMTDFIYTYGGHNSDTGSYIEVKAHYIYNPDQMAFDVEPIPLENAENTSPIGDVSRYIGMEIAPDTVLPDDIKDCGGFVATEDYVFCIGVCEKDGVRMLWLEEITKRDSEGHAYFKVCDVLVLPEIEDAEFCTMTKKGNYMYGAFGLAEYTDTEFYETVYRVWTVDREAKKIIEVPIDGYKGINEGYGV